MLPKKKRLRKPARRHTVGRTKRGEAAESRESLQRRRRLNDLIEQIDIIVPEVTARVAALEHLLIEKHLCTREDLVHAREFVRVLES